MTAPELLITITTLVAIYAAVALWLGRTGFERSHR